MIHALAVLGVFFLPPGINLECHAAELRPFVISCAPYKCQGLARVSVRCDVGPRHGDEIEIYLDPPAPGRALLISVRSVDPLTLGVSEWITDWNWQ